jgi:hypothetical protein
MIHTYRLDRSALQPLIASEWNAASRGSQLSINTDQSRDKTLQLQTIWPKFGPYRNGPIHAKGSALGVTGIPSRSVVECVTPFFLQHNDRLVKKRIEYPLATRPAEGSE